MFIYKGFSINPKSYSINSKSVAFKKYILTIIIYNCLFMNYYFVNLKLIIIDLNIYIQ